jgi:hypothetical protein
LLACRCIDLDGDLPTPQHYTEFMKLIVQFGSRKMFDLEAQQGEAQQGEAQQGEIPQGEIPQG